MLSASVQAERYALVVGNGNYQTSPLKNPVNDANDISASLERLGFSVTKLTNVNHKEMFKGIRAFGQSLGKNDVGLFYFAGHGMQVNGNNYLIPVGSNIEHEDELQFSAINAATVLAKMESAGNALNIIMLDACRNNPFARSFRSNSRGLARMDAPTGSMLVYATGPNDVASDGNSRNGLFTQSLLTHIETPNLSLQEVVLRTRADVVKQSKRKQVPWSSSSMTEEFYFAGQASSYRSEEKSRWLMVKEANRAELYQVYLSQYPAGQYVKQAKAAIVQFFEINPSDSASEKLVKQTKAKLFQLLELTSSDMAYENQGSEDFVRSLNKAKSGDSWEMLVIADSYSRGDGVEQNEQLALYWLIKAAIAGEPSAMVDLGHHYETGEGVLKSIEQAMYWYEKSAERGSSIGMTNSAILYNRGEDVGQNNQKAFYWYSRAAEMGNAVAMNNLADMYENGQGVNQDYKKAIHWYKKSAEAGITIAMRNLGKIFQFGRALPRVYSEGYEKARIESFKQAMFWFEKGADAGDLDSMVEVGNMHYYSHQPGAHNQAAIWYKKAAEQGSAWGMQNLGSLYESGKGVPQNYNQAFSLYQKAVDNGYNRAKIDLAEMYFYGRGVDQSDKKAIHWYKKAAAAGVKGMFGLEKEELLLQKKYGESW